MTEMKPSKQMREAASKLNEGRILSLYKDGNAIRMETERGADPYVWRNDKWRPMRFGGAL